MSSMWILWLAFVVLQGAVTQETVRAAQIHGRATDAETGKPVSRVPIQLSREGGNDLNRVILTDDDGRFQFSGLPAGFYVGMAHGPARGTYAPASLRIGSGSTAYRIALKDGEVREVNVALTRTYAIAVRVVDEWGEPLSGLRVQAQRTDRRGPSSASWRHETDDHGRMRIFGLEPGRYSVCVPMEGPGASGPRPKGLRRESLLTTCYPSATERDAEAVPVDRADVGELEIRMRRGRTFNITGRVLDASGVPAGNAMISLGRFIPGGSTSWGIRIDQHGTFTATNVQPGVYAIEATVGGPERPEHRRPYEAGYFSLTVEQDLEGLVVQMHRGIEVPGRLLLEDPAAEWPSAPGSGLMVMARLADDRVSGYGSTRSTIVRKDRTFTLDRVFGARRLSVLNVPRGWYVKSIQYDGKEVIDAAFEFKDAKNPPSLDLMVSNRGAVMSGRVVDGAGNPVRATVLAFRLDAGPVDEAIMNVGATQNGSFRLGPSRPGTYAIVALPAGSMGVQRGERERIARLIAAGEKVTLGELEERTVELRLVSER